MKIQTAKIRNLQRVKQFRDDFWIKIIKYYLFSKPHLTDHNGHFLIHIQEHVFH